MKYEKFVCGTSAQVAEATSNLSSAHEVKLMIDDGGVVKDVSNFKGVYNSTKGVFCAAVTPAYNVVTHKEYFDNFALAMDRLNMQYTMKIVEVGNKAFADIEFTGRNLKFDKLNEEFITGIRLINSYDKSSGIFIIPRFTRLACLNGMVLTRDEKTFSVKHHAKILSEIESHIEKTLNAIIAKDIKLQTWVSDSMADSLEWKTTCKLLEKLFKQPKHRQQILNRLGLDTIEVADKNGKTIHFEYIWSDKSKMKEKLNRWDVYNAITHYITHDGEHVSPFMEAMLQKKAEKLLTNNFEKLVQVEIQ